MSMALASSNLSGNPEVIRTLGQAGGVLTGAESLVIDSDLMLEVAAETLRAIRKAKDDIETRRKTITKPMDDAKKATMDFFRPFMERCETAEKELRSKVLAYELERGERIVRENEAAKAAAAAEAERVQAIATEAAASGDDTLAQALDAEAEITRSAAAVTVKESVSGVGTRQNWVFEVDLAALVKAAASDASLLQFLAPNEKAIQAVVREHRMQASIPGVRAFNKPILAVR